MLYICYILFNITCQCFYKINTVQQSDLILWGSSSLVCHLHTPRQVVQFPVPPDYSQDAFGQDTKTL